MSREFVRIFANDDFVVDYDKYNSQYRVSYFEDNHFKEECYFDAYGENEANKDFEKELRKKIAYNVEDKMEYMHCCLNEMDTYLHIIAPDEYPLIREPHCNIDCYHIGCRSYRNGENDKEKVKPIKKFTKPPIREDAWWCGYCPRCGQMIEYNYKDLDRNNRKQYCWNCGQLVEFK